MDYTVTLPLWILGANAVALASLLASRFGSHSSYAERNALSGEHGHFATGNRPLGHKPQVL